MRETSRPDPSAPLSNARILAVEDDFVVLLDVASVLHDAGAAAVKTCGTVEQALQMIDEERFSVAVLDVRLGRQSIAAVARKLTELGTPFVFYTGQSRNEPVIAQWPRAPLVSKPALPSVLVKTLRDVLNSTTQECSAQDAHP